MSTPAGWYADPTDPTRTRWWDGAQWTEHTAPLPPATEAPATEAPAAEAAAAEVPAAEAPAAEAAAPHTAATEPAESIAATTPIAPAPPIAPAAPPLPRYGEYAPAAQAPAAQAPGVQAPAVQAAPAYGGYPAAPNWAAQPVAVGPSAPGANTNTLWIYLTIVASTLPILTLFLVDWTGYLRSVVALESGGRAANAEAVTAIMQWSGQLMLVSVLAYACIAASIVFAWLDWRELKKRGVARPFHWAFAFFALIISIGVYIIGRTVVARRETGSGLTALWVWLGSIALSIIVSFAWFAWFWQQLMVAVTTFGV
jgi:hypothetical protein